MKHIILSLIFILLCNNMMGQRRRQTVTDGFPLANFSLTVNASKNGDFFGLIMKNPGKLGPWLEEQGGIIFSIEKNGKTKKFSEIKQKDVLRNFPFVRSVYDDRPDMSAKMFTEAFCPLGINDLETSSLPVVILELKYKAARAEKFTILINPDSAMQKTNCTVHCSENMTLNGAQYSIPFNLQAGEEKTVYVAIAVYDEDQVYANRFKQGEAGRYALDNIDRLKQQTALFSAALPKTDDTELNYYINWYMVPAVALTRCTKNGEVLTMGYCELNQRDSYWTSWLHLVMYKDLERKMLEESVQYQQESGKIPTTILPLIERHDDLDINAFFILRESRYYRLYKEKTSLAADWSAIKKAMDWLISRDKSGNGLPEQVSFWGDWKDVKGVTERRYSPFSGLIYLSALKEMVYLSREMGEQESADKYSDAYKKGFDFINKSTAEGGLWNGNYYCQIWKDGSVNSRLLQDQTVGILFGAVPLERAEKIIESLNNQSLTPYGIAETTPYYTKEEFYYAPATYHNGAVWPWMSFMDCWSRLKLDSDRRDEVFDLIKRVAKADLVDSGDYSPNEHINSLTGENLGFILQGWNAGLYGLVYFGLMHPETAITGDSEFNLKP
jgi:uncharacterized protein (DUF608 family)